MTERQASHLEERIDMLTRELAGKRRSTNWATNLTLLVGMLIIILLCVYFGIGYYIINDSTRPERIVQSAKGMIEEYAWEARNAAVDEIRASAPGWAEEVSNQFINRMPGMRKQAESALTQVLEEQLQRGRQITTEQFAIMLRENREDFREAIETLSDDGDTQEFVARIMPIVEKQYVPALRNDAIQILGVLDDLNRRLDRLATADDLNPVEEQQRHILGLARLLREERAPETFDRGELEAASR